MQKGQILISRGSWAVRWRETVTDAMGNTARVRRFKTLGPVLPTHRRNLHRVPPEIQALADQMLAPLNSGTTKNISTTITEMVEQYFRFKVFKPSTLKGYQNIWKRYLKSRIGEKVISAFTRVDAALLWRQIHEASPHLSLGTMRHIRFFLSGAFEMAMDSGLYASPQNPCKGKLPQGLRPKKDTEAYTIEEVNRLLKLFPSPLTQATIAVAFMGGLRKGEIQGLKWEDMEHTKDGAVLHVRRSVWYGKVTTPKTESSMGDVFIGPEVLAYIEAYRQFAGGPTEGYMFGYSHDHPINLHSHARWQIKPVLAKCVHCRKQAKAHDADTDHQYQRDQSLPRWLNWKAMRSGNATFLAKHYTGDGTKAASLMLRHSNTAVTTEHYIKQTRQERRAHEARKAVQIAEQRQQAAAVLGAGLRQQQAVN